MEMSRVCVQSALKGTYLCCLRMEPFRPEGSGRKASETWGRTMEREIAGMNKTWNELRWLPLDRSE